MAVRILKDIDNSTIDISPDNLSSFRESIISPLGTKLTNVGYVAGTNTTSISGKTSIADLAVTGHTGTVVFSGDVDSSTSTSSTNPIQNKVVTNNFVQKTLTIASIALDGNISTEDLSAAISSTILADEFDVETKVSPEDWDPDEEE